MTTRTAAAPTIASALMPLLGTAGGFVTLVTIGFIGGLGAMAATMGM